MMSKVARGFLTAETLVNFQHFNLGRRLISCGSRGGGTLYANKSVPAESANTTSLDPFGIEEVASAKDSTLVQGFYRNSQDSKSNSDSSAASSPGKDEIASDVSQNSNRLQVYDSWIKSREQINAQARIEAAGGEEEIENVRETPYGKIRLDSDNITYKQDGGQYPSDRMRSRQSRYNKSAEDSSENGVLTGEEFLRRFKDQARDQQKHEVEKEIQIPNPTVYSPLPPRKLVHRMSQADFDAQKFKESILDDTVGSNILPKPYQFPDFNKMTSQEIWNMLKSKVIFQNDFLFALNKPYGIPIHSPGVDCRHFIIEYLDRLADVGQCEKLYPLHRLDKETSGVLLFAKDPRVATVILEKFAQRTIEKTYLAVVKLCPSIPEGTIKIPIGEGKVGGTEKYRMVLKPDLVKYEIKSNKGQCREAITHFSVLKSTEYASFLKLIPETGVKHQIRLHLGLGLGCPIIGDQKYSHRDRMAPQRLHPYLLNKLKVKQSKVRLLPLHLHCNSIRFTLPEEFTKSAEPIYVHANVPYYFSHTLKAFGLSR